jgi:hypothetical protein
MRIVRTRLFDDSLQRLREADRELFVVVAADIDYLLRYVPTRAAVPRDGRRNWDRRRAHRQAAARSTSATRGDARRPDHVADPGRRSTATTNSSNELNTEPTALTILECRPPWREDAGADWTRMPIARLRFVKRSNEWTSAALIAACSAKLVPAMYRPASSSLAAAVANSSALPA